MATGHSGGGTAEAGIPRLVVITGAGSGIGRATALAFARRGDRVVAVDVDGATAEATSKDCAALAGNAEWAQCDVADPDAVTALAQRCETEFGPVDVLVNNAGIGMTGRLTEVPLEQWQRIRSINLDGVVHGCMAFGPAMLERGHGHVINVSSGLAYTPRATEPHYVTAKAGVLALSQCLRADWGPRGVGVTAICPGVINTPILNATYFGGTASRQKAERLFKRGHSPDKVGAAIVSAVDHDRALVPVGWESVLGWYAHRLLPIWVQQLGARYEPV